MTRRLAIIPARGGSKRIPGKNIREFCGKPMISHILSAAQNSGLFEKIHVSTECPSITKTVEELGFQIDFNRPDELADDYTPIMPVLKYVTERYLEMGETFDEIWLLMACSPLIDAEELKEAAKFYASTKGDQVVLSVSAYPVPVEWAFEMDKSNELTPLDQQKMAIRSQDLQEKYYDTGTFEIFPPNAVLEAEGAGLNQNYIGYVLSKEKVVDIDTEADWKLAELLYQASKINQQ